MIYQLLRTYEHYKECYVEADSIEEAKEKAKNMQWDYVEGDSQPVRIEYRCADSMDELEKQNYNEL